MSIHRICLSDYSIRRHIFTNDSQSLQLVSKNSQSTLTFFFCFLLQVSMVSSDIHWLFLGFLLTSRLLIWTLKFVQKEDSISGLLFTVSMSTDRLSPTLLRLFGSSHIVNPKIVSWSWRDSLYFIFLNIHNLEYVNTIGYFFWLFDNGDVVHYSDFSDSQSS